MTCHPITRRSINVTVVVGNSAFLRSPSPGRTTGCAGYVRHVRGRYRGLQLAQECRPDRRGALRSPDRIDSTRQDLHFGAKSRGHAVSQKPQTATTHYSRGRYACSEVADHWFAVNFREACGPFIASYVLRSRKAAWPVPTAKRLPQIPAVENKDVDSQ